MQPRTIGWLILLVQPWLLTAFAHRIVHVSVKTTKRLGPLTAINRFFGCDEPNFAYYPDGHALLSELGSLGPAQTYFRTHNLLTTGNGSTVGVPALKWGSTNAYTEDADGNPVYNWTIVDRIFDSYLSASVKPYVQVGFMPQALSSHPYPYFFNFTPTSPYDVIYTGWSSTPTSYEKREELVYQWTKHSVEKYGQAEVESWYWEVWNEPNINYWNGTRAEFLALHDHAIAGVRRALPTARVGGCEVAGGAADGYLAAFLDHSLRGQNHATGAAGTPLDFVSFHAKGAPLWINTTGTDGYVQMNLSTQLRQIDDAFGVVAGYPELREIPIIMGEFDPDGCAACQTPQYGYRNGLLYPSYTVATFVRALDLADRRGVNLQGALTWAFEYEETELFDETTYFDGFRVLATQGVDKPVLNAHRMLGMMTGERVEAESDGQVLLHDVLGGGIRGQTDVGVLASGDEERVYILVWHYHDNDTSFEDAQVELNIQGLASRTSATLGHFRVDEEHSNSYAAWLAMGSPMEPTEEEYGRLRAAGKLAMLEPSSKIVTDVNGSSNISFSLPIRALSLIVVPFSV
ncbi:beta-xylosidase [Neofusicoccum parvum]|uniref:Beta-xylosidase n=1 Tax=Neofusicoccum parvum TaxID=310453 RepID=A0ACB5SJG6_9PEZI|nr:beta-xylosidase [Neofusicoccum parvum]